MEFSIQINAETDWIHEGIGLLSKVYEDRGEFKKKDISLVDRIEKFHLTKKEMEKEFKDVLAFRKNVLSEASALFDEDSIWYKLSFEKDDNKSSYLMNLPLFSEVSDPSNLTYEAFLCMNFAVFGASFSVLGLSEKEEEEFQEGRFGNSVFRPEEVHFELSDIYRLLMRLDYKDETKFAILALYAEGRRYYEEFLYLITRSVEILKKHWHLIEKRLFDVVKSFETVEKKKRIIEYFQIEKITETILKDNGNIDENLIVSLYPGVFSYQSGRASIRFPKEKGVLAKIIIGILFFELESYENKMAVSDEKAMEQSRAIGDGTRFKILKILRERPHYGKEIADCLGVSAPSLSHHLTILFSSNLVNISMEDRKIYYSLNEEAFLQYGNYFIRFRKEGSDHGGD